MALSRSVRLCKTGASRRGIRIEYIQPDNPQQNAYVERFNRTVRYEWLVQYLFESIGEVQEFATRWLFAVLLGDRFGWEPVPAHIPKDHWKRLKIAANYEGVSGFLCKRT